MNKTEIDSELLKLAEEGDAKAQAEVGRELLNSFDENDREEGYEWYKKAALQGNRECFSTIVEWLSDKNAIHKEVFKCWLNRAKRGDKEAQYHIGVYFRRKQDHYSFKYKRENISEKNKLGLFIEKYIAHHYEKKFRKKALKWFKKSAEQGNARAMSDIASMYEDFETRKGNEKYFYWINKAADSGDKYSQWKLGLVHKSFEKPEHHKIAFNYFKEAADNDGIFPAQYNLGEYYEKGLVVEKSYHEAFKWYKKSFERHRSQSVLYKLGNFYFFGLGVEQSYEKAVFYYEQAANKYYKEAKFMLAICYKVGLGVEQNHEEAERLYNESLE